MTYDEILEQFKSAPVRLIPIEDAQTDEAFQPRVLRLVPIRDKGRLEESSAQHIATLRLILEGSQQSQLDPILLADIKEPKPSSASGLHVVDGHHRLKAYEKADRTLIPAHVLPMDYRTAVLSSKLVNCTKRALPMHPEQCREAAWQYVAELTQRGATDLPAGESLRTVGSRFGISKNTVLSMLSYLARVGVELDDFHPVTLDPGTGWPRWRHVREAGQPWRTCLPSSPEEQLDREAERLARQIVKIVDSSSPTARARALEMLANEEVSATDQIESVTFLSHFSPSPRQALRR